MNDTALDPVIPTELSVLKDRARMMGITFSNNIGVDALRRKIEAKMEGEDDNTDEHGEAVTQITQSTEPNPLTLGAASITDTPTMAPVKQLTLRQMLLKREMALVRLRITNLDPKKKDLPGEIFTVANEYIGTVKKYVPFGEKTDDGWHVPYCIYKMLKRRTFLQIQTKTDRQTGTPLVTSRYVREFALEVLPPLTEKELKSLAAAQQASGLFNET